MNKKRQIFTEIDDEYSYLVERPTLELHSKGYVRLTFFKMYERSRVFLHRTIYEAHHRLTLTPQQMLDHIDGDRLNNRIENLRLVTYSENNANKRPSLPSNTGYRNIAWSNTFQRYVVKVCFYGKKKSRHFRSLDEAITCAENMRKEIHGKFAIDHRQDPHPIQSTQAFVVPAI